MGLRPPVIDSKAGSLFSGFFHCLQLLDHTRLDEHQRQIGFDWRIEYVGEHAAPQMCNSTGSIGIFRLQSICARCRTAALRVTFDQRDVAIVKQLLVFRAQTPASGGVALHAGSQAPIQQQAASIELCAADLAHVLLHGYVRLVAHDAPRFHERPCGRPAVLAVCKTKHGLRLGQVGE